MPVEEETACNGWFDTCSEALQNITFNMFWKRLIGKSGDCPAVRITGSVTATTESPSGNLLTSVKAEGTTGAILNADIIAKLAAIGANKVFSVGSPAVDPTDISKVFVNIIYFI